VDGGPHVHCDGAVRAGDGKVEAQLTAAVPYAGVQASKRLELWGALGYGTGEVKLKTAIGGNYRADTDWNMATAGQRARATGGRLRPGARRALRRKPPHRARAHHRRARLHPRLEAHARGPERAQPLFGLAATRRESGAATPEHGVGAKFVIRW